MAGKLSAKKQQAYKAKFALFDKSGDGKISKDELRAVFKELKRDPTDADLADLLSKVDKDKSGFIEYNEFVQMMVEQDAKAEKILKETFDAIDKDHSGFITEDEMDSLFRKLNVILTKEELKKEVASVDLNKDGKISFQEFKKMWEKL